MQMKNFLLPIALLCFLATPALAEEVEVGTYILSIGEYNIEEGSYIADFYLWFWWEGDIDPSHFELMNGHILSKELHTNEPGYLLYRIRANLFETPSLKDYPIDTQKVTIKIEDILLTTEDLIYVVDEEETGIDDELNIMGWELKDSEVMVLDEEYPNWDETYSRYVHSITFSRPRSTLLKALIPLIFIMLTAWFCLFLPLHKLGEKLALGGTALLSSVVFHIYITEQIPPIGYMIMADKLAISLYATLIYILAGFIIVETHIRKENLKQAKTINKLFILTSLLIPLIAFSILNLID